MSACIPYAFTLLLLAGPAVPAAPPAQDDAKSRAQAFARSFYDWYTEAGQDRNVEVVLLLKKDVLAPELYEALKADAEVTSKAEGELVGLDFDPFLNTQEASQPFDAGTAVAKGDSWWVPLTDRKSHVLRVTAEVTCAAAGCRIANLHYPAQELPENENLVSILKVLARDRAKAATAAKAPADAKRSRK